MGRVDPCKDRQAITMYFRYLVIIVFYFLPYLLHIREGKFKIQVLLSLTSPALKDDIVFVHV